MHPWRQAALAAFVLCASAGAQAALFEDDEARRAIRHLADVGLPTRVADLTGEVPTIDRLMGLIAQDKKVQRGALTFILVRAIGESFVAPGVDPAAVRTFLTEKLAGQ